MDRSDAARLGKALTLACSVYRVPFTEELLAAYIIVLDGEDIVAIEESLQVHMRTSRFFPAPCDLLSGARMNVDLEALEAWHALRKGGEVPSAVLAGEALRLVGGHAMLREMTIQDAPHRRREFVETFKALVAENERDEMLAGLGGGKGLPS